MILYVGLTVIGSLLAALVLIFLGYQVGRRNQQRRIIELETQAEQMTKHHDEKLQLLEESKQKLADNFQALSSKALEANNESFMRLAKNQFEHVLKEAHKDFDHRQDKIQDMVQPVRESLEKVSTKIEAIEKSRAQSESSLNEQMKAMGQTHQQLQSETSSLVAALKAPQTRGRWGEMQLKRCVEMAGMLEYCDFKTQESQNVRHTDARLRPDMIVRLPANKLVVVDAKTPLSSYLEALETNDLDKKNQKLQDHARHVRKHIDDLSKKAYWSQFQPSPEFVVLFLPGESFFSAALEQDPSLIEAGVRQNVILSTPTTLIALLRAIAYGWQQEKLASNIKEVGVIGKELYKRVSDMAGHFNRLGRNLAQSVDSYNKTVGSLESRVLASARKMNEMKFTQSQDEIGSLEALEVHPRKLQAPELLESPKD